ncbi:MAG TPA: DUF2878 domain-containing protein [Gammaproteobacteria bacterium]|jgi:hypothetical protein|nr:DUF2878 domain-containing protein [Gammaproteobacteria bacterium]
MTTTRLVVNVAAFQAAWFGAIGGAAAGRAWLGPAAAALLVAGHLCVAARPARELAILLLVGLVGSAWDSLLVVLGLIEYRGAAPASGVAPYWIASLWIAFATTLNVSLRWLRGRRWLALPLGAVAGPCAYAAGESLGALRLLDPPAALLAQSVGFAVLLPLSTWLAARCTADEPAESRRA